jgi:cation:H+ antiporter
MHNQLLLWLQFLACSLLIFVAGRKLSFYADIIAEQTGIGKSWIGTLVLAPLTSLPEFFNGVSAVLWVKAPDIAIGGILGSCVCNLFILSLLDFISGNEPLNQKVKSNHFFSLNFSIIMLALTGLGMAFNHRICLGWVSPVSMVLFFTYFIALHFIYQAEKDITSETENTYLDTSLSRAIKRFVLNAIIIIIAAIWLPRIGNALAEITGLSQTFVGSIFIALSTSLPELVVTFFAFKLGNVDMAVSNILGSNIVNLWFIPIYDLLYTQGPLLTFSSPRQLLNIFSSLLMTAAFSLDLTLKPTKKWHINPLTFFLGVVYSANLWALYYMR